jgi:DtxR family transcriptional regulator, Mn-dependent transcriptional regulator
VRPDPNVVTESLELLLDRDERDVAASRAELARALAVDPADVDIAVAHLRDEGAVIDGDEGIRLTAPGRELAVEVVRRHRLTERLLRDVIGLDWSKVHHEAERWEGVISDEVEARLIELLGDPGTCPHGNPIPGSANRPEHPDAVRLDEAPAGPVHIVRITEELESDDEALRLLESCGFIPGRDAEIKGTAGDGVEVAGSLTDATLPAAVARHTYVAPR